MQKYENDNWSLHALLREDLLRQHLLTQGELAGLPSGWRLWIGMASLRFIPVLLCRLAHTLHCARLEPFARIFSFVNYFVFGIEIATKCSIGPGLYLPHTQGTVIGAWRIGRNATIFQGVTIGAKEIDFSYTELSRPTLKDNVTIGSGAKILGGIVIANRVRVGANSVVLSDVPEGVLAVGAPARMLRHLK